MNKRIMIIGIVLFTLSGCSTTIESTVNTVAIESENVISSNVIETDVSLCGINETIVLRTDENVEQAWESRLDYAGSGFDEITFSEISIEDIYSMEPYLIVNSAYYPELAEVVEYTQQELLDSSNQFEKSMSNIFLFRSDNRLLSVGLEIYYSQGDERYNVIHNYTWDYNGNELFFSDIVSDYPVFINNIKPLIYDSFEGVDGVDVDIIIEEYSNNINPDSIVYLLTNYAMYFKCDYNELLSGEQKSLFIRVDYRENSDLFNPQYLPGELTMISGYTDSDFESEEIYIDYNYYNTEYDCPAPGDSIAINYNSESYAIVPYISSEVAHSGASGEYVDTPAFILIIYDSGTGEELGSRTMQSLSGYYSMNLDFNSIIGFVDDVLGNN